MDQRPAPGYRALRKGRWSQPGGIYFVTTITDQRVPWFQVFEFATVVACNLERSDCLGDAQNLCWVVMPDHVHLLLQLGDTTLGRIMNRLKSRSAVLLNREIGRNGRFWAPGYYEHALRKEENLRGVARYIVANPVRAGLVKTVRDYPYWNASWL